MNGDGQTAHSRQTGGADDRRGADGPPQEFETLRDHVMTCSKCGFCQPSCPIFRATGREAYVARGKVALYRNILEGHLEIGPSEKDAFSATRKCHDANGEISYVFFGRKQVRAGSLFANEKRFFSG